MVYNYREVTEQRENGERVKALETPALRVIERATWTVESDEGRKVLDSAWFYLANGRKNTYRTNSDGTRR